jgi:hypothetical protein
MLTIATQILDTIIHADKIFGNAALGLAFIEATQSETYYLTPQAAAARTGLSDDTTRRLMSGLLGADRVTCVELVSARRTYRLVPQVFDRLLTRLPLLGMSEQGRV